MRQIVHHDLPRCSFDNTRHQPYENTTTFHLEARPLQECIAGMYGATQ
jgi:hypothetical protein